MQRQNRSAWDLHSSTQKYQHLHVRNRWTDETRNGTERSNEADINATFRFDAYITMLSKKKMCLYL